MQVQKQQVDSVTTYQSQRLRLSVGAGDDFELRILSQHVSQALSEESRIVDKKYLDGL
jgi:hypothetical protein